MQYDKKAITVQAPAKLNLTLSITGRRADGYHLLDSFFVFCGLHDVITIKADDELLLDEVSGPFAVMMGSLNDNLVIRAAKLLRTQANIKAGARIALIKNIPVAAGLGGGSADAAATLRALNQLWKLNWPHSRLEELAAGLGADIPACIQSKPVIARGIGDILSSAPAMPEYGILLVNPLMPTPTPEVFKAFKAAHPVIVRPEFEELPVVFPDLASLVSAIAPRGNDLLEAAISVQPAIKDVLEAMGQTPDVKYVGLSGSGATCFALYGDAQEAEIAGELINKNYPSWLCWTGSLI
jgi:4-diphosphocytidyl-2-C-methyl-D-erythritol kinase